MCQYENDWEKLRINIVSELPEGYNINPRDINVPPGYKIEVFAVGLDAPSCMVFEANGDLLIGESGIVSKNPKVIRLSKGQFHLVADNFRPPITGINVKDNNIYVSHKGYITVVRPDGSMDDIITGLPSNGDYGNSNVVFGADRKLYFGQGTVTNSGVVGEDNYWVRDYPYNHDNPGSYVMLNGQNFASKNVLALENETVYTGAFSSFGEKNMPFEIRKGVVRASGSILRANLDGTELELVAWGLRYPSYIKFDHSNHLYAANQGFDNRGSRPIANASDEFCMIQPGLWYGWPDYTAGEPVSQSRFKPEGGVQPEFLLTNHPNVPMRPYAIFPPYSAVMGFDFNYSNSFGQYGDVYIAELGGLGIQIDGEATPYASYGHRVSRINMSTGGVTTFAINKSGFPSSITREGGFGRPIDVEFGPDKAMYVLDFGRNEVANLDKYYKNTGVIWKITRNLSD